MVRSCVKATVETVQHKQNDHSGTHYLLVVYEPGSLPRRHRTAAERGIRTQVRQAPQRQRFRKVFAVIGDVVKELS
ncbi:MAG: hypothetical protein A2W68_01305 [Betaproteobacteria bacterium RIFCSPLOWO2_02_64_14]|nr:MAG: hypothetical protein A2W68_01305 [Betaproteobacteria bacterium RIFCSPLOWO2_02_64_14]